MTLRSGHGNGRGTPRIEVLPADELPVGVRAPEQAIPAGERTPDGRFVKGGKTVQAIGGRARRDKTKLAERLGLADHPPNAAFETYWKAAAAFCR